VLDSDVAGPGRAARQGPPTGPADGWVPGALFARPAGLPASLRRPKSRRARRAPDAAPPAETPPTPDRAGGPRPTELPTPRAGGAAASVAQRGQQPRRLRLDPGRRAAGALGVTALGRGGRHGRVGAGGAAHAVAVAEPERCVGQSPLASRSSAGAVGSPGSVRGQDRRCRPQPVRLSSSTSSARAAPGRVHIAGRCPVYDAVRAAGGTLPGVRWRRSTSRRSWWTARCGDRAPSAAAPGGAMAGAGAVRTRGARRRRPSPTRAPGAPVDLNTATADQLQTLPASARSRPAKSMAWRAQHGPFNLGRPVASGPGDR